ncbi:hypothetical protein [Staphylococcus equorum]|uniref:hypothetical protein n=1 Tax=Staphylococcus equorum TaxID=246432 RepID=UPI00159EF6C1|nr:hypothetical protein [Staphylococcus equorum]
MKTSSSYTSAEALVFHFTVAMPGWDDEILLEKLDFCPTPISFIMAISYINSII